MKSFFLYIKQHKFLTAIGILIVLGAWFFLTRPPKAPNYETATVKMGDVLQEVSVTGRVTAEKEAELAFEKGGRVSSIPLPVGAKVNRGDVLVRLDDSELVALLAQAKANIAYEEANLAQLQNGSRPEEIAVSESTVSSALIAQKDAELTLSDKINTGATVADDAIFNKTDYLFENPRTINPHALFPVSDQQLVTHLEQTRAALTESLAKLDAGGDFEKNIVLHKQYFNDVKNYLDGLASAINSVLPSSLNSQTTIDGWKANVSLARSNMNTAISAIITAEQAYRSASSALLVAQNQLALKKVGPTAESVSAQEAKLSAMKATLENYNAQIAKMLLRAPFSGIITKQDAKIGQTVAPNTPVVSLQSLGKFQIEANVPEVDVAKISLGDSARVTLDAYGADTQFPASVSAIDPAETILEGVSTYKVTLHFDKDDERVRSGMTANIDISTDKKEGVLFIPARAVTTVDGKKFVRVLDGLDVKEVEVVLGLRGSDGSVEVQSGLTLGQSIITFMTP